VTYADYTACGRALDNLVGVLGLRSPSSLDARYHRDDTIAVGQQPVVFIGLVEHHSNELPWRESLADVVVIPQGGDGRIDAAALERELFGVRRPTASQRLGLGCQQHHPASSATRHLGPAASPWRLVLLGLHRGRPYVDVEMYAVPERDLLSHRTPSSSARTS